MWEVRGGGAVRAVCPGAQSCPESSLSGLTNLWFAVATACSLSLWQEKMQSLEIYGSELWGGGRWSEVDCLRLSHCGADESSPPEPLLA